QARHANFSLDALRRFFEGDLDVVAQIGAALRAAPLAAPAEHIAEAEHLEDVFKARKALPETGARLRRRADPGVAKAVVTRAHLGLRQDLIGFVDLFEFLLGSMVAGILVRVVLD